MAIEKIKRTKSHKREAAKLVPSSPDLEETRKQFQEAVVVGPSHPLVTADDSHTSPVHHSGRRRTLMVAVAALIVVLATSASTYAFFWYQSPDKVVMDAVMNAAAASSATYSGTVYEQNGTKPTVTYNGAFSNGLSHIRAKVSTPFTGDLSTINTEAIIGKDVLFIKLDKTSQLVRSSVMPSLRPAVDLMMPEIKSKADDKWIELTPGDLSNFNTLTLISQCTVDVMQRMTTDAQFRSDVLALYDQSPFLHVTDSGPIDDKVNKYTLSLNADKFNKFLDILIDSKPYQSLAGCRIDTKVVTGDNLKDFKLVLEINKAERQITHVEANTGGYFMSRIVLDPVFNIPVTVAPPTSATNFNDIKAQAFRQYITSNLGF